MNARFFFNIIASISRQAVAFTLFSWIIPNRFRARKAFLIVQIYIMGSVTCRKRKHVEYKLILACTYSYTYNYDTHTYTYLRSLVFFLFSRMGIYIKHQSLSCRHGIKCCVSLLYVCMYEEIVGRTRGVDCAGRASPSASFEHINFHISDAFDGFSRVRQCTSTSIHGHAAM